VAVGILLVGGFGTRLAPLTNKVPKPMLTIAGLPVTEHQLAMAKKAGITTVVLATSYLSEVFVPYFGDGSKWGMNLLYAVEKEPLGTGGAIRNATQLLNTDEPIVVFNGDVLSSHDLAGQIKKHLENKADVTLHLTRVADARAYGAVPTDSDGRVTAFLEKMDNPMTNTINAGCYVFKPEIINSIALNTVVSVERETFPALVSSGAKIFSFIDDSYWLDIGTPKALLQGSIDLVSGRADGEAFKSADVKEQTNNYLIFNGAEVDPTAKIFGGSCIGAGARIGAGAQIEGSIIEAGVLIESGAQIKNSFIAKNSKVAPNEIISSSFLLNGEIFPLFS